MDKLKITREARIADSPTYKMLKMLKRLESELAVGYAKTRNDTNLRKCPFCDQKFINGHGLGGHVRAHCEEPNYLLIREAYKFLS